MENDIAQLKTLAIKLGRVTQISMPDWFTQLYDQYLCGFSVEEISEHYGNKYLVKWGHQNERPTQTDAS